MPPDEPLTPELPDFDAPLDMLLACHQRMLAQCGTLEKLVAHVAGQGVDSEAKTAIGRVVNYFDTSAVHHHQDEEQDLFPLLARQSLKLADIVHALRRQHAELTQSWDALSALLKKPAELAGRQTELAQAVERFCSLYRDHITREEKELLALARHILSTQQLEVIGDSMARRRGVRR
jgi:hemerythrin-like domain-containing protein